MKQIKRYTCSVSKDGIADVRIFCVGVEIVHEFEYCDVVNVKIGSVLWMDDDVHWPGE